MGTPLTIKQALEPVLADLRYARKHEQVGKLALLVYCDVKRWARHAGKGDVADLVMRMFSESSCKSKGDFLQDIDELLGSLEMHGNEQQACATQRAISACE